MEAWSFGGSGWSVQCSPSWGASRHINALAAMLAHACHVPIDRAGHRAVEMLDAVRTHEATRWRKLAANDGDGGGGC